MCLQTFYMFYDEKICHNNTNNSENVWFPVAVNGAINIMTMMHGGDLCNVVCLFCSGIAKVIFPPFLSFLFLIIFFLELWLHLILVSLFVQCYILLLTCWLRATSRDCRLGNVHLLSCLYREGVGGQTTGPTFYQIFKNVNIICEFHDHIWNHHKKCILISTNMLGFGLVIPEIPTISGIWENKNILALSETKTPMVD